MWGENQWYPLLSLYLRTSYLIRHLIPGMKGTIWFNINTWTPQIQFFPSFHSVHTGSSVKVFLAKPALLAKATPVDVWNFHQCFIILWLKEWYQEYRSDTIKYQQQLLLCLSFLNFEGCTFIFDVWACLSRSLSESLTSLATFPNIYFTFQLNFAEHSI